MVRTAAAAVWPSRRSPTRLSISDEAPEAARPFPRSVRIPRLRRIRRPSLALPSPAFAQLILPPHIARRRKAGALANGGPPTLDHDSGPPIAATRARIGARAGGGVACRTADPPAASVSGARGACACHCAGVGGSAQCRVGGDRLTRAQQALHVIIVTCEPTLDPRTSKRWMIWSTIRISSDS